MRGCVSLLLVNLIFSTKSDEDSEHVLKLCSICLENIHPSEGSFILSCNHTYHEECIKKWARRQPTLGRATCPECRADIDTLRLGIASPQTPSQALSRLTTFFITLASTAITMPRQVSYLTATVTFLVPVLASRVPDIDQRLSSLCEHHPRMFSSCSFFSLTVLLVYVAYSLSLFSVTGLVPLFLIAIQARSISKHVKTLERDVVREQIYAASRKLHAADLRLTQTILEADNASVQVLRAAFRGREEGRTVEDRLTAAFDLRGDACEDVVQSCVSNLQRVQEEMTVAEERFTMARQERDSAHVASLNARSNLQQLELRFRDDYSYEQ